MDSNTSNKDAKQVCTYIYTVALFYTGIISYKHQRALFGSEKCKVFSISGTVGVSLQFSKWCVGVVELESSLFV